MPPAAAVGGKLYAFGGLDNDFSNLRSVEAFDPQTGAWAAVASMPTARSGARAQPGEMLLGAGAGAMSIAGDRDQVTSDLAQPSSPGSDTARSGFP